MKTHMIKSIYYDDGVPDGGRTYCGITEYSENMEGCFTKQIDEVSCQKCLMSYNKEINTIRIAMETKAHS